MKISKKELFDKYGIKLDAGKYSVKIINNEYHIFTVKDDTEGCVLVGMVRHMNAISNCAPAVALITKMIKEAKQAELKIV